MLPKTTADIELILPDFTLTSDNERFFLFYTEDDERIISFASDIQLDCLKNSTRLHVDGTFKTSPNLYFQSYLLSAFYEKDMFPCMTVILKQKSVH